MESPHRPRSPHGAVTRESPHRPTALKGWGDSSGAIDDHESPQAELGKLHEQQYLWLAILTRGASVLAHPVRPASFHPKRRPLYRAICDMLRAGQTPTIEALAAHTPAIAEVGCADGVGPEDEMLDAATCAAELEDAYQRRREEAALLARLEELRMGAPVVPEEEAA